jgi:hypothetical protein
MANRERVHFLHIGKTGGSAIRKALEPRLDSGRYRIVLHYHHKRLCDVPAGDKVVFMLRHPVSRFASGFNSRLRQGRPLYHVPWTKREAQAFNNFGTPNELAEALSHPDDERRNKALRAMGGIEHVRNSVWQWFRDPEYFASRSDDILFVGFQETLDADFRRLTKILGLGGDVSLPTDPVGSHRTPGTFDRSLSDSAERNLRAYYAADIEFYEQMKALHSAPERG